MRTNSLSILALSLFILAGCGASGGGSASSANATAAIASEGVIIENGCANLSKIPAGSGATIFFKAWNQIQIQNDPSPLNESFKSTGSFSPVARSGSFFATHSRTNSFGDKAELLAYAPAAEIKVELSAATVDHILRNSRGEICRLNINTTIGFAFSGLNARGESVSGNLGSGYIDLVVTDFSAGHYANVHSL